MRTSDTDSIGSAISRFGDWISGKLGLNSGAVPTNNWLEINSPTTADSLAETLIASSSSSRKALVLQGAPSQSASVLEIQGSNGVANTYFLASGTASITTLSVTSGFRLSFQNVTLAGSTVSAAAGPIIFIASMTAATQTLQLPYTASAGQTYFVMDQTGVPSASNVVTVQSSTGGTVLGTNTIITPYGCSMFVYNGSNWYGYRLF